MGPSGAHEFAPLGGVSLCVLYGGRSSEREVSLSTGRGILEAFRAARQRGDATAPAQVLGVEIQGDGTWLVDGEALKPGLALDRLAHVDLFFLGLHGTDGEDGMIQGLLGAHDRRFTGSGVSGSAIAMDKEFSRRVVAASGLTLARGLHFSRQEWQADQAAWLDQIKAWASTGWVIKPRCEGSSVGVSVLHKAGEIAAAVEAALALGAHVLVEEWIDGIEVAAGVYQTPSAGLQALPIVEICPKPGHFFDYEEKYSPSGALEHCPPKNLKPDLCAEIQRMALVAHKALRLDGYSRTDFIVPKDGPPVFLETNTLPGMTPRSLLPLAALAAGLDFYQICQHIALEGLTRTP